MPKKTFPVLTTDRLTLRAFSREDVEAYLAIRSDASILESTGLAVYQPDDTARAERFIRQAMSRFERGRFLCWGIFLTEANTLLGVIYETINKRNSRVEIGYYSGQDAWGNGYMSEALGAVTACNFDQLGLHRQQAWVVEGNHASERVLEKNGFTYEGTLREYLRHPDGTKRNVRMYGRIKPK
jgi:ribosomal-protein-alanine N-acetyltransferase